MHALTPPSLRPPFARYSHGIIAPAGGRVIVTSGQLAMFPNGTIPDGAQAQAEQCFAQIDAILRDAGAGRDAVVRVNAFVTDRAHMAGYMAARDAYFSAVTPPPASTLLIVSGFTLPEFLVEVEVTALLPA
jgi:enamine deaminase RidA (YjgF/YER057c/UK114 family)